MSIRAAFTKDRDSLTYAQSLSGVAPDVDGDLAFLNLETVVTDRNDLAPDGKGQTAPYNFRSHPPGVNALTRRRASTCSRSPTIIPWITARRGAEETLYHMAVAGAKRAIAYAGIGADFEEATRPGCLEVGGMKLRVSAPSASSPASGPQHRAGQGKPGQAAYREPPGFRDRGQPAARAFRPTTAFSPSTTGSKAASCRTSGSVDGLARLRGARRGASTLIVGHHPHVAQGVELIGKSLIFYGLGNFLHPGTAEMNRFGLCRDYGLMAKVHLAQATRALGRVAAIEAIPLTNTHNAARALSRRRKAAQRIFALNYLGAQLGDGEDSMRKGVRFTPRKDGSGLYCADGASQLGGKIGAMCAGWQPAPRSRQALARHLAVRLRGQAVLWRRPQEAAQVELASSASAVLAAPSATCRRWLWPRRPRSSPRPPRSPRRSASCRGAAASPRWRATSCRPARLGR